MERVARENTKEAARAFINAGGHCRKRYGWAWKGGRTEPCSKEEALKLLDEFDFGEGFYMLEWRDVGNTLEFCKLSEYDML